MDFENIKWDKENYFEFINYLFKNRDEKYSKFHSKLLKNKQIKVIGIRTPFLKKIAKKISKTDYLNFIKINNHEYYEEIILHGLIITYLKDYENAFKLFEEYINFIDNWASCDIIVSNFKIIKKDLNNSLIYIKKYLKNENFWINRVGIVFLLSYYINDDFIDEVLKIVDDIKSDEYYVKMANAWLISMCLVKYYEKTYNFLLTTKIDKWTYNKALQKSIESYRIKDKEKLQKMKI